MSNADIDVISVYESKDGERRINNEYTKHLLRQAKIEDDFPSYADVSCVAEKDPNANFYEFNGFFHDWLQKKYGMKKYGEWWYRQVNIQSLTVGGAFKKVYGFKLKDAWNQFAQEFEIPEICDDSVENGKIQDLFTPDSNVYSKENSSGNYFYFLTNTQKGIYFYKRGYIYFIDKNDNVFDYANYQAEVDLAVELAALLKNERNGAQGIPQYEEKEINKIFESIKKESHIEFSPEQEEAIKMAFTEPIVIITGGPGTGKTTIVHAILKMYLKLNKDNSTLAEAIALLAPTGRAAKRLKESTNMPSSTIHKFLGYQGENYFQYSKTNRTNARLIIVDEASMMDLPLASRLITSMHNSARLIIVGDVDQLPSVGPGQVLKDLIDSKEIKTIRLNKIHRQAADSSIIKLAHNINEGILPENLLDKLSDRNFIATSNEALPSMIVDLYAKAIEKGKSIKDTQVLIPMYKGETGINEINNRIQEAINPSNGGTELKHLNRVFRLRDKVIQLVNRAEKGVMNGDIGYVSGFTKKNDKISGVEVSFDLHVVSYELEELDDLTLAYAISIHKSQGSEFELVIMPFTTQYYVMLKRKLIYTGITRAKKTLLLIL